MGGGGAQRDVLLSRHVCVCVGGFVWTVCTVEDRRRRRHGEGRVLKGRKRTNVNQESLFGKQWTVLIGGRGSDAPASPDWRKSGWIR